MICDCGFKFTGKRCPICKKVARQKKKPKTFINARSSKRPNMAKVFREYVQYRYPGYAGESVNCDNCKMIIRTLKFENISHKDPKSLAPGKATDFENFEILCGPTDYWGKVDNSCHTLWERNRYDEFKQKSIR